MPSDEHGVKGVGTRSADPALAPFRTCQCPVLAPGYLSQDKAGLPRLSSWNWTPPQLGQFQLWEGKFAALPNPLCKSRETVNHHHILLQLGALSTLPPHHPSALEVLAPSLAQQLPLYPPSCRQERERRRILDGAGKTGPLLAGFCHLIQLPASTLYGSLLPF